MAVNRNRENIVLVDGRLACYTGSSVMSAKMLKSRHLRKFQSMISSSMRNYIMALFDNVANQRAPGQLQLDDCTRPSPWGSLSSSLSRRMPVRWHAAELTVKLRLTDRLLSPMRTYCVLGYLLLGPHWPPHPPSQRFIFVLCIAAHKRAELY